MPDRGSNQNAQRLRGYARKHLVRQWPKAVRPIAAILSTLIWPLSSYREAKQLVRFSNPDAGGPNLKWKVWRAALRHNLPPAEFGAFGAWRSDAAGPGDWLYTREASLLTANLTSQSVRDLLGDKAAFADFCASKSPLSVIETLATFKDGIARQSFPDGVPPETDLISKPIRASMGRGVDVWTVVEDGFAAASEPGTVVPKDDFSVTLAAWSKIHPYGLLVQRRLDVHETLAHLSDTGPAVVRVITGRWRSGSVEPLNAMLQRPNAGTFKTHGGPFRLIDLASGRTLARLPGPHIFPTATDDPEFDDIALPDWQSCLEALVDIHTKISDQAPLIGWDVIFTPDGPTILEANSTLAPYFFQLATQRPASDGKWTALLSEYLP